MITKITATLEDGSEVVIFPVPTPVVPVAPTHIEVTDGEVIEVDVTPKAE